MLRLQEAASEVGFWRGSTSLICCKFGGVGMVMIFGHLRDADPVQDVHHRHLRPLPHVMRRTKMLPFAGIAADQAGVEEERPVNGLHHLAQAALAPNSRISKPPSLPRQERTIRPWSSVCMTLLRKLCGA